MNQSDIIPIIHNTMEVYHALCKPFCKEQKIPQTAFDILMFLANHPQYDTAKDIIAYRGIPANLVSKYVEFLVAHGFLKREPIPGNRRSIRLICTKEASVIIENGRKLQNTFFQTLLDGVTPGELENLHNIGEKIAENILIAKNF